MCCNCQPSDGCAEVSKWILMGMTVMGWIFSIVSVAHCSFVQVGGANVGLFKGGYDGSSCVKYPSGSNLSTAMKTARAFGVLLTLGLSFAMIIIVVVVLLYPHRILWNIYRVLLSFCFVFNLFTFVAFAECADLEEIQNFTFITCSVGGASVCAILNSWLLLPTSILSCCIPLPKEPVFKDLMLNGNGDSDTPASASIKRTIEETTDGKKITEEITDRSGNTTVTITFEPSDSMSAIEGFEVGPTVKTVVTNLPNGKRIVEEDATGNKTITTKIVIMAGQADPDVVVGVVPQPYDDNSSDAVMAAAIPMPIGTTRDSFQSDDEERGMTNPYLSGNRQDRRSESGRNTQPSSSSAEQNFNNGSISSRSRVSRGQPDSIVEKPSPYRPNDTRGYREDLASSAFVDSANYDSSFMGSSSTYNNSFMESSSSENFDSSFAQAGNSSALDGAGDHKPKKKKKKKKKHKHGSDEHGHSSKRAKKPKESSSESRKDADEETGGEQGN